MKTICSYGRTTNIEIDAFLGGPFLDVNGANSAKLALGASTDDAGTEMKIL